MNFFLILQFIICLLLVISIILQKSSSDSIAGINPEVSNNSFMSSDSISGLTQKIIILLIVIFLATSIVLANLSTNKNKSLHEKIVAQTTFKSKEVDVKK